MILLLQKTRQAQRTGYFALNVIKSIKVFFLYRYFRKMLFLLRKKQRKDFFALNFLLVIEIFFFFGRNNRIKFCIQLCFYLQSKNNSEELF